MLEGSKYIPREIQERYEIQGQIGRPEKWESYVAVDRETGRKCMVRLDRKMPQNPRERENLKASYLMARRVRHTALPEILRLGLPPRGGSYVVSDYVEGTSIRNSRDGLDWRIVVEVMAEILPALHLLHTNGIVHHRLTPDKIILDGLSPGRRVKLVDIGPSPRTDKRRWAPWHIQAPEVARGAKFDGRADLYSLAVAVHEVMTGSPPYSDTEVERAAKSGGYRDIPPISTLRGDCPPVLEELLLRMGSHDPKARPKSALALAKELPRTGLLNTKPPSLDVRTVLEASRWRLCEERICHVIAQLPEDLAEAEITWDDGLGAIADEIKAQLMLRHRKGTIKIGEVGHSTKQTEPHHGNTSKVTLIQRPGHRENRRSNDTETKIRNVQRCTHVVTTRFASAREIRSYLKQYVNGPLAARRAAILADWILWRTHGLDDDVIELLETLLSVRNGSAEIDWQRVQKIIGESIRGFTESQRRTFPSGDPRTDRRALLKASMPYAAGLAVVTQDGGQEERRARTAAEHFRAGLAFEKAGATKEAAESLASAAAAIEPQDAVLSVTLLERGRAIRLADSANPLPRIPNPTNKHKCSASSRVWRYTQRVEEEIGRKDPRSARETLREALADIRRSRGSSRSGQETRETSREYTLHRIRLERLAARVLHNAGEDTAAIEKAEQIEGLLQEAGVSVGGESEIILRSGVLYRSGELRRAKRLAIQGAKDALLRGNVNLLGIALELLAAIEFSLGRYETAIYWGEQATQACEFSDKRMSLARRLCMESVLLYGVNEYRGSVRCALRSLRVWRRKGQRDDPYGANLALGLGLLSMGRLGGARRRLRKVAEYRLEPSGGAKRLNALLGLAEIAVVTNDEEAFLEALVAAFDLTGRSDVDETDEMVVMLTTRKEMHQRVVNAAGGDVKRRLLAGVDLAAESGDKSLSLEEVRFRPGHSAAREELLRLGAWFCNALRHLDVNSGSFVWGGIERVVRRLVEESYVALACRVAAQAVERLKGVGWTGRIAGIISLWERARKRVRECGRESEREAIREYCGDRIIVRARGWLRDLRSAIIIIEEMESDLKKSEQCELAGTLPEPLLVGFVPGLIHELQCVGALRGMIWAIVKLDADPRIVCFDGGRASWMALDDREFEVIRGALQGVGRVTWDRRTGVSGVAAISGSGQVVVSASCVGYGEESIASTLHRSNIAQLLAEAVSTSGDRQSAGSIQEAGPSETSVESRFCGVSVHRLRVANDLLLFSSPEMHACIETIEKLAIGGAPVVLMGESGTGKELLARYYHQCSKSSVGEFVPIDCPALCSTVAGSELFGHKAGSFTGASGERLGLLETAAGGTVFLDEVGDLSGEIQAMLLRVLSSLEVRPVGSSKSREVRFALVSATNVDLREAVLEGRFRRDLMHRLGIPVAVPALRDRRSDILPLWDFFVERYSHDRGAFRYEREVADFLMSQTWFGNIRELENVARAAVALSAGERLSCDDLERIVSGQGVAAGVSRRSSEEWSPESRVWKALDMVRKTGRVTRSSYAKAAKISERSALRDLSDLVNRGVLRRTGNGRATRYVSTE